MTVYEREVKNFRELNQVAKQHGVVLFGSTFAKGIPVCELRQAFDLDCDIYNRSLSDLSVFDAKTVLADCVNALHPSKILLQLGETDLERGYRTIPEIVSAYEEVVRELQKQNKNTDIVLVSVCENKNGIYPAELNKQLEALAKKEHCRYADIGDALSDASPEVKTFHLLERFIRNKFTFNDVANLLYA